MIYKILNEVHKEISKIGISKDQSNRQQGYKYRGIDDVYNALSPIMAKHGLLILPECIDREIVERSTSKGGLLFYQRVTVDFDLIAAEDGSTHTIRAYGEAMDSSDKSTNKAITSAYKYALFQIFCIPTESTDADEHSPEAMPKKDIGKSEAMPKKDIGKSIARVMSCPDLGTLKNAVNNLLQGEDQESNFYKAVVTAASTRKHELGVEE